MLLKLDIKVVYAPYHQSNHNLCEVYDLVISCLITETKLKIVSSKCFVYRCKAGYYLDIKKRKAEREKK